MMGYITIFSISFLAATMLPFSSELTLAGLINSQIYNNLILFFLASTGNILGSCVNWWLGIFSIRFINKKWFPFKKDQIIKASNWFKQYGKWSLLFSWIPFIGDPLTYVAGTLKVKFLTFLLLVSVGKIVRYYVIYLVL